jgi:positive regulator of sigma E activity
MVRREEGVVVEVLSDDSVRIGMSGASHDKCGSCGLCQRDTAGNRVLLEVRTPVRLTVGDRVTVEIPGPGAALSGVLLFLLPLILFVGGILLVESLRARGVVPFGSWVSVLAGLLLMVLSYTASALYDRRLRRSPAHQPRLLSWPGHDG